MMRLKDKTWPEKASCLQLSQINAGISWHYDVGENALNLTIPQALQNRSIEARLILRVSMLVFQQQYYVIRRIVIRASIMAIVIITVMSGLMVVFALTAGAFTTSLVIRQMITKLSGIIFRHTPRKAFSI